MPDVDGAALWREIKARQPALARRMLFVTGDTLSPSVRQFLDDARCDALNKPFTREALLACEAAGHDVVIVETVGVGQSETAVAGMTDLFVLLQLPNAGDELQGIKKGIIELADMIAVNKADGAGATAARAAAAQYQAALHILAPSSPLWSTPVVTISGLTGDGLDTLWAKIEDHCARHEAKGLIADKRHRQDVKWRWAMGEDRLKAKLRNDPALKAATPALEAAVAAGTLAPTLAADDIAQALGL